MSAAAGAVEATAWRECRVTDVGGGARADCLAEETPVALVLNGISHTVMMCSPSDLEDFALGFVFTEGLVDSAAEVYDVEAVPVPLGIELRVHVSAGAAWRLRERRRTLAGRTGCGLCGADSLGQVYRSLPLLEGRTLSAAAVLAAHRAMPHGQALQHRTGATHAAAWCCAERGDVHLLREDVGRHNALDKLIGALLQRRFDPEEGFLCITSRASFEMVQKCAAAGIASLAAASAPTARAVDVAQGSGVLLMGFVRGDSLVTYTYPERLTSPADLPVRPFT